MHQTWSFQRIFPNVEFVKDISEGLPNGKLIKNYSAGLWVFRTRSYKEFFRTTMVAPNLEFLRDFSEGLWVLRMLSFQGTFPQDYG